MTAVELFAAHPGGHCAPPSPVTLFFRRIVAAMRRKPAVPEIPREVSGTATALLTTGELAALHPRGEHPYPERPTVLPRHDGQIVIDESNHIEVCPWPAAEQPAYAAPPEPARADDTRCDLPIARPYAPMPACEEQHAEGVSEPPFWQKPKLDVLWDAIAGLRAMPVEATSRGGWQ